MRNWNPSAKPSVVLATLGAAILIAVSALAAGQAEPRGALRITSIQPAGTEVPPGRQIVVQFDRKVVPVGRMERTAEEIPITITPALDCEWRWLDTSSLACQLGEDDGFRPATRYEMTVRPGIETESGETLAEPVTHSFETERPSVTDTRFDQWLGPETPRFYVTFNQRMSLETVRQHLHFAPEGGSTIGVQIEPDEHQPERYFRVQPSRELPPGASVQLVLEKGLTSVEGPLPTVETKTVTLVHTFPASRFLGVRCRDNEDHDVFLRAGAELPGRPCNPMAPVEVVFSAPVVKEVLRDHLELDPDLAGGRDDYDPWEALYSYSRLGWVRSSDEEDYSTRLPELLHARTTYHVHADRSALLDEFGRPLEADVDFLFSTDDRPPRAVLTHPSSTLEKGVATHVPIVVTNLDSLDVQVEALTASGRRTLRETLPLAPNENTRNIAYRYPLPTRKWLSEESGVVFADVATSPSVSFYPDRLFSQVTPFAVHAKVGHQNSLVWVTDMRTGEPVEGARVFLYRAAPAQALSTREPLSEASTDLTGVAMLAGQAELNPLLETSRWQELWNRSAEPLFFVSVSKGDDLALVPLASDFWIYPEATNDWIPTWSRTRYGHVRTWGTTAQGVYRLGDTIQYKLYVRDQNNDRFVAAPSDTYGLKVFDPMDKMVHEEKDLTLDEFGAHDGEVHLATNGAVGWYRFELSSDFHKETWEPLRVLVADFTPAPFRVTTDLDGERYEPGDEIRVSTSAALHAGGPYADAEARITINLTPMGVTSENPKTAGFWFGGRDGDTVTLHQSEDTVDREGKLETTVTVPDQGFPRGRLLVESAVRDDRGKYIAGRATADYMGRDRFVGVRAEGWVLHVDQASELQAIVIDTHDEVAPGVEITLRVQYRETTASRVKGAGNAYITQYNHNWLDVTTCTEDSTSEPSRCAFTPDKPGLYRLSASILDTRGRSSEVATDRWAVGKGRLVWEESPGNRLDIEPEKSEYHVGDRARFLIRNPYPGAKALVTIERYGVRRRFLKVLESSTELLDIPIGEDDVPGFYLSVVVTSPRVEAPLGDDEVDLGKPAFRMGYVQVPVRDPVKEIEVDVRPEHDLYRPGDKVKVALAAQPRLWAGTKLPPMELAVAVLDEAVFDLVGRGESYFDPYEGFYSLEPLDVENFNLLTRLIGIQKFEKKGANPGGDGGGADLRTLFKFVSYWNPSVRPDENGKAEIEFEVPDNLTGWRVLVMAVTKEDRMGLGQGHFVVNQPTEIRPALPNQVTEGDRFEARFTVMNRTEEVRVLTVTGTVEGVTDSAGLSERTLDAEPYKRYDVSFPVRTTGKGELVFTVKAGDLVDRDALRVPLDVKERKALEVAATYGTTTEAETRESFAFPENMRTDVGRVSVVASPSVLSNLEGAFEYLRNYPYLCWEQKITKAVMASHYGELRGYLGKDFSWAGAASLPDETLALAASYQAPNGGMVYWIPEDEYASPYLSAYTALAFQWLRDRGHSIPSGVETRLQQYLREFLRRDAFPEFYTRGMSSTVRAVALAALALSGSLDRADLERYRSHVSEMDLFGKAHFLMAANAIGAEASEVRTALFAHSNRSGGKITFTETVDDAYRRILSSPERTQCAILSALTRAGESDDTPFELTRAITQSRKQRNRWENTQENVFCMNALIDYSRAFESETPSYTLRAFFDSDRVGETRFTDLRDEPVELDRALRPQDPGRKASLRITKEGPGRLYYAARLFYSKRELATDPVNAGMELHREYSVQRNGEWILLQEPMRLSRGELVKVDLFLSLPAPRNFVVVDDPVPGGLEPVNRDLATSSTVDADQGEFEGASTSFYFTRDDWFWFGYSRWSFYHKELRHDAARFFSEYLPAGNYHLSYVAQAIAPGEFQVLPSHAEEMYDPDVFGQGVPGTLTVESRP